MHYYYYHSGLHWRFFVPLIMTVALQNLSNSHRTIVDILRVYWRSVIFDVNVVGRLLLS